MRNRFTLTLTILCGFLVSVDTSAETSSIVDKGDYKYLSITSGPLNGKIAWAFDTPGGGSNALGLLLRSLRGANKIVWASYKPTHPAVVELLKGHKWAWGVYDENYCGRHCEDAFDGNKKVSSVELGVYKESSRRKWFVMHHKFASLDYSKGKSSGAEGAITGSFNWNEKAAERNYEDIVYVKSRPIAEAFWREYKRIRGKHPGNGGIVRDGNIAVAFNEFCPPLLVERFAAARKTIRVAVWTISTSGLRKPNPVYDALFAAAGRGVDVKILTDSYKARKRDYGDMNVIRAEMPSRKDHMHHKFAVIDGEYVLTGSYNYITKALSGNYENVLSVSSPAMAASYEAHWRRLKKELE